MTSFKKGDPMFRVYEVFKADGKELWRFESKSKEECESWIRRHENRDITVVNGLSEFVITLKGVRV